MDPVHGAVPDLGQLVCGHQDRARGVTSLEVAFAQVLVAMVVIGVAALVLEEPGTHVPSVLTNARGLVAMLWLGLAGTGVAFVLYFVIIDRWGAMRATLIAYVMPVVAIGLGFLILDERLQPLELVGSAFIIAGIVIVNAPVGQRRLLGGADAT